MCNDNLVMATLLIQRIAQIKLVMPLTVKDTISVHYRQNVCMSRPQNPNAQCDDSILDVGTSGGSQIMRMESSCKRPQRVPLSLPPREDTATRQLRLNQEVGPLQTPNPPAL